MSSSSRHKIPSRTSLVLKHLIAQDDMLTARQIADALGESSNCVATALAHLQRKSAVCCVEGPSSLWWFATPSNDKRHFIIEEHKPETKPRRKRQSKVKSLPQTKEQLK